MKMENSQWYSPKELHEEADNLKKSYKGALLDLSSFQQACSELMFNGNGEKDIRFKHKDVYFHVHSSDITLSTNAGQILQISTVDANYFTEVILTTSIHVVDPKQGNIEYRRVSVGDYTSDLEISDIHVRGTQAIGLIQSHIEELKSIDEPSQAASRLPVGTYLGEF